MEDIEVARLAVTVANGTEFKNKLTANPNGSYTLTADIDMGGAALQVVGFTGVLDGAGHTIKNVTQLLPSTSGNAGIFSPLLGTVKNLKLSNVNFKALNAGGLASSCSGAIVQNVTVSGSVEAGDNAGGICGSLSGGSLTSSSASGSVKSRNAHAGGLVGASSIGRSGLASVVSSCSVASMTVTGVQATGGLMGYCQDATILRASVDATVSGNATAGGVCGEMNGGSIASSYAKGTSVTSSAGPAGGLVGTAGIGLLTEPTDRMQITTSYAQYPNVTGATYAGGILGYGQDPFLYDIYVVGNVTGTGGVGGLIGRADSFSHGWTLNNGIYRGGVVTDRFGPWAGVIGVADTVTTSFRWTLTLFDSTRDGDPYLVDGDRQKPATTLELKAPTTSPAGVYCWNTPPDTVCGDSAFPSAQWSAGTSTQHHILRDMPGPNVQMR